MNILDAYIQKAPDKQSILDIFAGEWSSAMPGGSGLKTQPGNAQLFDDIRIKWAEQTLGGFRDLNVLELGPLEAGHTYMLHAMGAKRIVAVEANTRAYLKCLCIKEIFGLQRVEFKLGDFVEFMAQTAEHYDAVIASGVLYHMLDPLTVLERIAKLSDKVFLWTHYYDAEIIRKNPNLSHKFADSPVSVERNGAEYQWVEQSYKDALNWAGFCGGGHTTSRWLTRDSILNCLRNLGFSEIAVEFEQPDHPNGPAFSVCAQRR